MNKLQLKRESLRLEKEMKSIRAQLKHLPEGKLILSRTGKYYKWYQSDGKNKVYIPKSNRRLAEQLAWKKYLSLQLEELSSRKKTVDSCLSHQNAEIASAEKLLAKSLEYQNLLSPYFKSKSKELEEWKRADYKRSKEHPEHLLHPSISGNVLRSKSEVMIDMMLYSKKIPYRYEEVIQLNGQFIVPDFTIRHPRTGDIFYWEHFGKMDDPKYVRKTSEKIRTYSLNGIIPSKNLIMTFENTEYPLTLQEVEKVIEDYFGDA